MSFFQDYGRNQMQPMNFANGFQRFNNMLSNPYFFAEDSLRINRFNQNPGIVHSVFSDGDIFPNNNMVQSNVPKIYIGNPYISSAQPLNDEKVLVNIIGEMDFGGDKPTFTFGKKTFEANEIFGSNIEPKKMKQKQLQIDKGTNDDNNVKKSKSANRHFDDKVLCGEKRKSKKSIDKDFITSDEEEKLKKNKKSEKDPFEGKIFLCFFLKKQIYRIR